MEVLIYALVIILIAALVIWLTDSIPMDGRLRTAARIVVIIIAILLIVQRAGFV